MNKLSKLTALLLAIVLALGVPMQVMAESAESVPSYIETLQQYLEAANTALEGEILSVEEYVDYLEMTGVIEEEHFIQFYNQLTEDQILEMQTYLNDKFWAACMSYTRVGPFLPPVYVDGGAAAASMFLLSREATAQAADADGVELNKTVVDNKNGTYTVTLESYAEGDVTVTTTTEEVPCDIILVLDMSTSMDEYLSGKTTRFAALKAACEEFTAIVYEKAEGEDKKPDTDDDVDHRISLIKFSADDTIICGLKDVSTQSGQNTVNTGIANLSQTRGTDPGEGLASAHNVFNNTASTTNDSVASGKRNRIVVFFTDGYPSESGSSDFDAQLANKAIAAANTLKVTDGATVYSIVCCGVSGVGPEGTTTTATGDSNKPGRMNLYLHAVSSNYPTANANSSSSTFNPSNVSETDRSDDYPDYYISPENVEELKNIFKSIANNVNSSSTTVTLGTAAVVKDVVTPYFDLPDNLSGVKVYTVDCTGFTKDNAGNDVPTWSSTRVEYTNADIKFGTTTSATTTTTNADGTTTTTTTYTTTNVTEAPDTDADPKQNTVWVENFDYKANYVANAPHDDPLDRLTTFYGRKLVIEFDITPVDGFLGGNDVETNLPGSGIYEDSTAGAPDTTLEDFINPPNVDIELWEIQVIGKHQHIFLSNEADMNALLQSFSLVYTKEGFPDETYEVNGIRNDYATLVFSLKAESGYMMKYTIEPGATVGTWTYVNTETGNPIENFDVTPFLTNDAEYTISYEVIPKNEGTYKKTTGSLDVGVHVYKPTFTFKDTVEDYLASVNAPYYSKKNFVSESWSHTYYNEITVTINVTYDANGTPSYSYVVTDKDKKVISTSPADWNLSKTIDFAGYGTTRDEYYNVVMSGPKPSVKFTYSPLESTWIKNNQVTAVECVNVNVNAVTLTSNNTHEKVEQGSDGAVSRGEYTTVSVYTEGSGSVSATVTKTEDGTTSEAKPVTVDTTNLPHIKTMRQEADCTFCNTSDETAIYSTDIHKTDTREFVVHIKNAFSELQIIKKGLSVGESAIFTVSGKVPNGTAAGADQTWTIVLTKTSTTTDPSAIITGLLVNSTAIVAEDGNWSWRYKETTYAPTSASVLIVAKTDNSYPSKVTVTNGGKTNQWLDDEVAVKNNFSTDGQGTVID